MRTIITETKAYKFEELTDQQKEKAIDKLYDISVDHDWWDSVYDDAEQIGLKITEFDIDRGSYCNGEFIETAPEVAKLIIANHGKKCETYKTAENYLKELKEFAKSEMAKNADDEDFTEDDIDFSDIDDEFLKSLLEDYLTMLRHEYEYLTSEEAIIETINANDYEFDENGNMI
jgi:hypothetical protein